jgi:hypothetical protein
MTRMMAMVVSICSPCLDGGGERRLGGVTGQT